MGGSLSELESRAAFTSVMQGEATAAQIAALLIGLRVKGETPDEVAGAAGALRSVMVRLPTDTPDDLVDTCGTGGGAVPTFNISTAAALLAAGLGVRIAKHGNRSFTTQCGSADVLEALGVPVDVSVDVMARALRDVGIVFMFAPLMHPAMRHVGPIRRELSIPTVMNIVGPLANPASAGRQVVGVGDAARVSLIAGALQRLGSVHALVVHGEPGMDEISPLGLTRVVEIRDGVSREWTIDPSRYGFGAGLAAELAGGTPLANAAAVIATLNGSAPPTAISAVALNAAAALYVAPGGPLEFGDAVVAARQGLADGVGLVALNRLRAAFGQLPAKEENKNLVKD
ncbi:MAG: Anthranilate phosphoribosyltransferase [Gemmatimonadetes bacterium]|nr:Anthranilate phosphoribosyltransferase [Gemmatimonadota bacterium]